jgi:Arc/MetJ-type ribon-helix-helix transcriptional regulator
MKVELTPDAAQWVEAEIAAGTFPTPEDAVRHAIHELRVNALRATLDSAVAEGGRHTMADARRYVREQLENPGARRYDQSR